MARLFAGRPGRVPRRVAAFAAAASVAAAVALGLTQVATQHQLESTRTSGAAITRVVTAPDARIETQEDERGRQRHRRRLRRPARSRRHHDRAGFPPAGRIYQVWVMSPAGARSAGLLARDGHPAGFRGGSADRIGIPVEPAGSTSRPTTTPSWSCPSPYPC